MSSPIRQHYPTTVAPRLAPASVGLPRLPRSGFSRGAREAALERVATSGSRQRLFKMRTQRSGHIVFQAVLQPSQSHFLGEQVKRTRKMATPWLTLKHDQEPSEPRDL